METTGQKYWATRRARGSSLFIRQIQNWDRTKAKKVALKWYQRSSTHLTELSTSWAVTKLWLSNTCHTNLLSYFVWHSLHFFKNIVTLKEIWVSGPICYFIFTLSLFHVYYASPSFLFLHWFMGINSGRLSEVLQFTLLCLQHSTQTHSSRVVPTYLKSQFDILSFSGTRVCFMTCLCQGNPAAGASLQHLFNMDHRRTFKYTHYVCFI